jgi:predicted metal-dependent phosphoesterase TrpH
MANPISRRRFIGNAVAVGAGWTLLPRLARALPAPEGGLWLAGDLHCHTIYSHDVWAGPGDDSPTDDEAIFEGEAYTFGWTPGEQILNAETRSLDFLAITDHNDVRALRDPGYTSKTLTLIPGYEHSMSGGHGGCLGVSADYAEETLLKINTSGDAGAVALREAVHQQGGLWILNHPYYSKDETQSWKYSVEARPDSIEVWNIGWPYRGANPAVQTSNNYKSLALWENYLHRWGRMPANGGSDNHWRATTAVQGVGQPTTWVYAADRSMAAILDGIRNGRTTVSAEPPGLGGARLFLNAGSAMVGDTVAGGGGPIEVTARVVGAPGHMLRLNVDGSYTEPVPVLGVDFTHHAILSPSKRVRAEVYLDPGYWMAALSSPIYFS